MLKQSSLGENVHWTFSVVRDAERSEASPFRENCAITPSPYPSYVVPVAWLVETIRC